MESTNKNIDICRKTLSTLKESFRKPSDELDASSYHTTCLILAESCHLFLSLISEFAEELSKHYICVKLTSLTEKVVNCLLKIRRDVKSMKLIEQLLAGMEKLVQHDNTSVDLDLTTVLIDIVVSIRNCLPLCEMFSTSLQNLREFQADPSTVSACLLVYKCGYGSFLYRFHSPN